MGEIFQRDNESILSYIIRARKLGNQILDVIRSKLPNNTPLIEADILRYENESRDCLIRKFRPEIEQKISKNRIFRETAIEAVKIEKQLHAKELLRGEILSRRDINDPRRSYAYDQPDSQDGKRVAVVQKQVITRQICYETGHSVLVCYKLDPHQYGNIGL